MRTAASSALLALVAVLIGCGEDRVRDLPADFERHMEEYRQHEPVEQPVMDELEPDAPGEPGAPERTAAGPEEIDDPEPAFEGTVGPLAAEAGIRRAAILRSVRAARNPGFDRVVLELEGDETPGYHVEYVDRPIRRCGSGEVVDVPGDGWLAVRLTPAVAHETRGRQTRSTIAERNQRLDLPTVAALVLTCDDGVTAEWVIGVRSPNPYRVLSLRGPGRIVVDVLH